ncbi:MAG: hypothetical protein LKE85_02065 [Lachnospiraceae bacterium]|jgi:hypothetical protein|nr:hypothetical protein [Lachnospiraceae bacterium]
MEVVVWNPSTRFFTNANHNMSFDEAVALIGLDESEIERLQKSMDKTA